MQEALSISKITSWVSCCLCGAIGEPRVRWTLPGVLGRPASAVVKSVFVLLLVTFGASKGHCFHVLIDPGHGGNDKGASRENVLESNLALKLSQRLADRLSQSPDFKVSMTRKRDQYLSLQKRIDISKQLKPDLMLSLHLNSSPDSRVHGKEVYFQNQMPTDEESMFLASRENHEGEQTPSQQSNAAERSATQAILEDLKRSHRVRISGYMGRILIEKWRNGAGLKPGSAPRKISSRNLRQAPFFLTLNSEVPTVLVELGYLTHPEEGTRLTTESFQQELIESLYDSLAYFKETMDKSKSGP